MGAEMMKNASMAGDGGVVNKMRSPCWLNVESERNRVLIYAQHRQPQNILGRHEVRETHLHLDNSERNMLVQRAV